jgi:uncharacterized protein
MERHAVALRADRNRNGGPVLRPVGFDRILTVIGGRGLLLDIEGGRTLDVREPCRPVRFRGEDRIVSRLEAGPVAVLNLMADRKRNVIDVAIVGDGVVALDGEINLVYALEQSAVDIGEGASLAPDETLRIEGAGRALSVISGRVALAKISLRSAP